MIVGIILLLIAGIAEGIQDKINFHYDKSIFSSFNKNFWNISDSYLNKYVDKDSTKGKTFRGKYLVFTTDAWHLMKFISRWSTYIGLSLILISWDINLLNFIYSLSIGFISRSLTFNLIWEYTNKRK